MTPQLSRTRRVVSLAVLLTAGVTLSLAACSSDSKTAGSTAAPTVAPTAAPAETTPPAPAETGAPADTTSATTSPDTATADTTAAGPVVIEVDADSGSPIAQTVPLGTALQIHVVTKTDQEFHLHGYDIELAGTDVTFEFTATKAGDFELESHATEAVILNLTVTG